MQNDNPSGQVIIVIESVDHFYDLEKFGLTFNSTDEEIIDALQPAVLEEEGFNIKTQYEDGAYTIKRVDSSQNIYIFPKSRAG